MARPPEETHVKPVRDSRGLPAAWRGPRGGLVEVPGGYRAEDAAHAETVPCAICAEPAPPVLFKYATDLRYGVHPQQELEDCIARVKAKQAAERERLAATATAEPAPAPAKPAITKPATGPRTRAERLKQAKTVPPKNTPGLPADPAPGSSGAQDPAGGAA